MPFTSFVFYCLAAILLFAGVRVVTAKHPVHAALWLVLSFFTAAGLWVLLEAEFLAITLVLVYVGAVMVLFLFVLMMLDINIEMMRKGFWKTLPLAALVSGLIGAEMVVVLGGEHFGIVAPPVPHGADYSNIRELGRVLYTDYVYAFELAAVVLLVAMVAAIALTFRRREGLKWRDPATQVVVRKEDRLRMVNLKPQKVDAPGDDA
jgi:NADH-quinone oxidoreductase subunit J